MTSFEIDLENSAAWTFGLADSNQPTTSKVQVVSIPQSPHFSHNSHLPFPNLSGRHYDSGGVFLDIPRFQPSKKIHPESLISHYFTVGCRCGSAHRPPLAPTHGYSDKIFLRNTPISTSYISNLDIYPPIYLNCRKFNGTRSVLKKSSYICDMEKVYKSKVAKWCLSDSALLVHVIKNNG